MLAPVYPAATVAGNVETSQAVTGALYAALGVQAEGSGTMNNLTFGNDRVQYYETVASGSGAGDGFDGADAVQTHMTNSRLTDPEVLEWRYPVRVDDLRGTATAAAARGRWRGGRRRRPAPPLPGADDRGAAHRAPPRPAVRHGGRRTGRAAAPTSIERADGTCDAARAAATRPRSGPGTCW